MLGCGKNKISEFIRQRKEETGSSFLSLLWKELAGYVSLASFCTMNVGLIIYFLFNTEGLFGNFFKTVPFIDGLAAGAVIGIVLQRMTRTKEEDKKEERSRKKQKPWDILITVPSAPEYFFSFQLFRTDQKAGASSDAPALFHMFRLR